MLLEWTQSCEREPELLGVSGSPAKQPGEDGQKPQCWKCKKKEIKNKPRAVWDVNFVFSVLKQRPMLPIDRHAAERSGPRLTLHSDELAFHYRGRRQPGDYTGGSERLSLNRRQKAANRRLPRVLQLPNCKTLAWQDLTAGALASSLIQKKRKKKPFPWLIYSTQSVCSEQLEKQTQLTGRWLASRCSDNKLARCHRQKCEQIVSRKTN